MLTLTLDATISDKPLDVTVKWWIVNLDDEADKASRARLPWEYRDDVEQVQLRQD